MTLSPLLLVLCMIPLSSILRKENAGYELKGKKCKINHLLFMDDLKLYGKSQDQIDSLIRTVRFSFLVLILGWISVLTNAQYWY